MLYSTFISSLRVQVGDLEKHVHVDWSGDGTTTVFLMPLLTFPVLESSYTVKIGGVTKTETTDYTLNKETGAIVFTSAPANAALITMDAKRVSLLDSVWLDILNATVRSLGDDFYKEFTDDTQVTTANMLSFDLATPQPKCIAISDVMYREVSSDDYEPIENFVNWRYARDENKLYFGSREAFPLSGKTIKLKGLKTYVLGTTVADTFDVQDKYLTVIEFGAIARYWRYKFRENIESLSKMTQETTRTPLQELIMLADRYDRWYTEEKAKLKPMKPARIIPVKVQNGGRP